ncbi:site-specific DNA-methyltransferase [Clostridium tepidum]|uniref:site-specific DNA-methyltransferase n=1 Tax=Clostridium tepidum TaxID=1962263 RepID=UPI002149B68C|nr:site-specific DNA-methyltransferase [Clostridium tepidum]MCR1934268.1 site-specific DNA-methyltransferase [Clostridium tepidum]
MIYIDPPYNTGNDFIYKDDYSVSSKENELNEGNIDEEGNRLVKNQAGSGRFHSNWLNMMYPRMKIAKDLLSEDGVIFISIGQDELANQIKLCNDVFGESNCLGIISRQMKTGGGSQGKYFSHNIDYIIVYAKIYDVARYFRGEISEELSKKVYNQLENEGERKGEYYRSMGLYQSSLGVRPGLRYWIQCPDGTLVIPPGETFPSKLVEGEKINPITSDGVWRWSYDKYIYEKNKGNIEFKESTNGVLIDKDGKPSKWNVYTKIWLKDRQEEGQIPADIITKYENRHSSKELTTLDIPFDFAKPSELIKYLIYIMQQEKDIIVLDFFSGSATTAHAVMKLNAEDGGNRKFIMVQLPEECDEKSQAYKAGYKNICEIGKERIRRTGEKIKEDFKDKEGIENLDIGFKVFKVADTNIHWKDNFVEEFKDLYTKGLSKDALDFNPNFTDIDVVYEIILRHRDFPLTSKIEKLSNIGERTYIFADAIVVCLEEKVTDKIVDGIAAIEPKPIKVIFRDSAFEDDISLKLNTMNRLDAQLKKHNQGKEQSYRVEFI